MTPLEQAEALLKAAEEATRAPWIPSRDFERTWWVHAPEGEDKCPLHNGGRGIVESNTPTDNEENDIKFVALARNTAPAIALALIEKHRALEAALAETEEVKVERVARAIIMQTQPEYEDDEIWAEDLDILKRQATRNQRGSCFLLARAAIAAMGE